MRRSDTGEAPGLEQDGSTSSHQASHLDISRAATLALGKNGAPSAASALSKSTHDERDFAPRSTSVHPPGLIGSPESREPLREVVPQHSHTDIRDQARRARQRLAESDRQPVIPGTRMETVWATSVKPILHPSPEAH